MPHASDASSTRSGSRPCSAAGSRCPRRRGDASSRPEGRRTRPSRRDRVAPDLRNRPDVDVVGVKIGEEERETLQAAVLVAGAGDQQDDFRLERLAGPDLAAVDAPAPVAVGLGTRGDAAGVGAGVGFGDPERDAQLTSGRGGGGRCPSAGRSRISPPHQYRTSVRCTAEQPFMAASLRAISWSITAASVMPRPPPPYSSGIARPSQPPSARRA